MSVSRSHFPRRSFLRSLGQAGVIAVGLMRAPGMFRQSSAGGSAAQSRAAIPPTAHSRPAWKMALHNHGSFSEGQASWYSALAEAEANGIDVIYATDHDWRMQALDHRPFAGFTGLREDWAGSGWTWTPFSTGELTRSAGGIATNYSSPSDPSKTASSLKVVAKSAGADEASHGFRLDDDLVGRREFKTNIAGQVLAIDVRASELTVNSWVEMRVTLSYYPVLGKHPAGSRVLSYRFGTKAGTHRDGLTGIVWLEAPDDEWTTFNLDLEADVARLFPELPDPRDNATVNLAFVAVSRNGALAKGWFDYLRFNRSVVGAAAYEIQREIFDSYRDSFAIDIRQGDEISLSRTHHTWLFSQPQPIDYAAAGYSILLPAAHETAALRRMITSTVHDNDGLVSYNHPFGVNFGPPLADPTAVIEKKAAQLLGGFLEGNDMLEVGYAIRGRVTIDGHLGLWDILSRNETFMPGFGATDSHGGETGSWAYRPNRFLTTIRSPTSSPTDLKAGVVAGQIWCTEMGPSSDMELDIEVEGVPMGSVSVAPDVDQRFVTIVCRDVPAEGILELVQGPVDHGSTYPTTSTIAILTAKDFTSGIATRTIDTSAPSFIRTQVRDATGRLVAFGNPIWLLHETPAGGIPPERQGEHVLAQEVFTGSGTAPSWKSFGLDVDADTDLVVRLDGVAEGSAATLFLKNPSGAVVSFDRSPAQVKYVKHASSQPGRWLVGVGINRGSTDFRVLVNPANPSVAMPSRARAAWQGRGDPATNSWQRFRFTVVRPGPVEILLDQHDPAARVSVFLRDGFRNTLNSDESASHSKSIIHYLPSAGRYDVFVKVKNAPTNFDIMVRPARLDPPWRDGGS